MKLLLQLKISGKHSLLTQIDWKNGSQIFPEFTDDNYFNL